MTHKTIRLALTVLLSMGIIGIGALTCYAHISNPDSYLMQEEFNIYRPAEDYAFANPAFVSGTGTNLLADGHYYNLIESDYYKINKDDCLKAAYMEYQKNYQDWINMPDNAITDAQKQNRLDKMVFNADGIFKAFLDDYTNPTKTVYLTVIATTGEAAAKTAATEDIALIYDSKDCPCVVVRFKGSEEIFNRIINDPDVLFVAPAFGESISPYHMASILATGNRLTKDPADARDILRHAVGLPVNFETDPVWSIPEFSRRIKTSEKWFFIGSDLNFDGHITADDARSALRIAVGLSEAPFLDTDV